MKKIPTLFVRNYERGKITGIKDELTNPELQIVLDGKTKATIKTDGACAAVIDGMAYKRYDAKNGKPIPNGAIKCQEEADPITGHLPCWVPIRRDNPADKWFVKAFETRIKCNKMDDGTYEVYGKHFNGNPYELDEDFTIKHGIETIVEMSYKPLTFEKIKDWLYNHNQEGIVFWYDNKPLCKIKRSDFGMPWGQHSKPIYDDMDKQGNGFSIDEQNGFIRIMCGDECGNAGGYLELPKSMFNV